MKSIFGTLLLTIALVGCQGSEVDQLKTENVRLRSEVDKLTAENMQLKATAEYHFRLGRDYLSSNQFDSAIAAFQTVIDKYPQDSLVGPARESLIHAEKERNAERDKRNEEARAVEEARDREVADSGEPVDFGVFYAKSKTGMQVGKRYRFRACLNQIPCVNSAEHGVSQSICSVDPQFDDVSEYERWLSSGQSHCGTIVAAMQYGGSIGVYRLH